MPGSFKWDCNSNLLQLLDGKWEMTLTEAGGPIEMDRALAASSGLAEFCFRRSGMKSNYFSRKSHFREKFLSRSERASEASAMSGAYPLTFQSPAKRV